MALAQLLRPSSTHDSRWLKALIPEETYGLLGPHCVLKHLEQPYLYDITADDLYELDQKGFQFLKACHGGQPLSDLSLDKDFMETCFAEGLLTLSPEPDHRRFILRPSPVPSLRYLELQLTSRCNLKCKHCYLGEPASVDLPLSAVLSLLEEFEEMQGLRVLFSGGEPLLYPHFSALNDALPRYTIRKVLLTNGTLIRKENYSDWRHFDEIQFSIDGLEKAHEIIRGKGTFQQTVRGMEAAQEKGMPISVATMVHRHNLDDFEALSKWLHELKVVEWNIDVPCSAGRLRENEEIQVDPENGARFLEYATGGSYHGGDEPFACGYHLCAVTPDGKVLKCGFFDGNPLGSLKEGLEASWKRAHHVPIENLECASCQYVLDCKGGCRFRASSPLGKDLVMCAVYGV
jgi:radical SAM protein with 4Fe4S-binding SPASM domain